jgi:hypothetical protein
MPGEDASKLDTLQLIEQEAVRRILVKSQLSREVHAKTFEQLVMASGFPYRLAAHKFKTRELDELDVDMRKRPTKAPLMMVFDELKERHDGSISEFDLGLCFPWRGYGGLHVLTCDTSLPSRPGTHGRFWQIGGIYFLLQHIDSLIGRLGPPEEW